MAGANVGIVGAGITGLALTHHLAERGVSSVTCDAADEAGGVIQSVPVDGRVLEVGPQRMRRTPGVATLIEAAGLEDRTILADPDLPLYVYVRGRLRQAPLDPSTFARTDLLSWPTKLRMLAEPLTRAGRPTETAADLFTRKFGERAYRDFVGPLWGGIYGSDPAHMPAKYALADLLEREAETHSLLRAFYRRISGGHSVPPVSFRDGLQALPRELAGRYADRVHLDTPVEAIAEREEGYALATATGTHEVEHVVVTAPADAAAALLGDIAPGTASLADLTYNPLALVHLESAADRDGFGYQVGLDESLHTLGASWNASMFDRDGVYTVFLGGMHEPDLVSADDDRLASIATAEFETVMGAPATVLNVSRLDRGFPAWDESWSATADLSLPDGVHLATNYTARMGVPSRIREARELAERLA